jgi:hypothetical protein
MTSDALSGLIMLAVAASILFLGLWIYVLLPADMASDRHRSAFGWVLVSLMFSPLLACLLLWLLGDNPNQPDRAD